MDTFCTGTVRNTADRAAGEKSKYYVFKFLKKILSEHIKFKTPIIYIIKALIWKIVSQFVNGNGNFVLNFVPCIYIRSSAIFVSLRESHVTFGFERYTRFAEANIATTSKCK